MADILSKTGTINFDVDFNGIQEMKLDSTGLGIGLTPSANLHVQGNALISNQILDRWSNG